MSIDMYYYMAVEGFKRTAWYEREAKEFLTSILPKNFYNFVYDINEHGLKTYKAETYYLIKSLLQLGVGHSDNKIIFDNFDDENYILTVHNNHFKIVIKSHKYPFTECNLDFYRQDNNNHFLSLYTGFSRSAWVNFIHLYLDLIWDNYNNDECKEYYIGYNSKHKLGYFVHTQSSFVFSIPERHEHILTSEEFDYFHNKYVLHKE